jgi:hypothetical protein
VSLRDLFIGIGTAVIFGLFLWRVTRPPRYVVYRLQLVRWPGPTVLEEYLFEAPWQLGQWETAQREFLGSVSAAIGYEPYERVSARLVIEDRSQ